MFEKRALNIKGASNFRDLGGYIGFDGRKTTWGKNFRAAALTHLTSHDLKVLKHHRIHQIIDFRTLDERLNDPDIYPDSVENIELPVLDEDTTYSTLSREQMHQLAHSSGFAYQQMMQTYERLITDNFSQRAYRQFFNYLLANEEGAILFHCTKGKDRTGVGTALFLTALGVDKETVFQDYVLTDDYNQTENEAELARLVRHQASEIDIDNFKGFWLTDRDYLENAFSAMIQLAGSPENYLKRYLDLDQDQLDRLRDKYLD
ncbi:tyrosine-protein phosphatase [Oenococcus sicerae]|uniref:tyrosine-protein phosphatase n=1 Tax=Oenococcus sicerae TaxID=2203724 RepID=UPI0010B42E57|nr:hypothetical protein OAL24_00949 [Oenococcus sicerae]